MTVDLDELERLHGEARQPNSRKSTGINEHAAWNAAIWEAWSDLLAELRQAKAEIDRLRTALRKHGPCAAVSRDGRVCIFDYEHQGEHGEEHADWPDAENDPVATAARQAEIRRSLVDGGW